MNKFNLLYTFILLLLPSFSYSETIRGITDPLVLNLAGDPGFAGRNGEDAMPVDCSLYQLATDGEDGENGASGEVGEKGEDLYLFENDLSKLSVLTINQSGGVGGAAGVGGLGAQGCHGGVAGQDGSSGDPGKSGALGKLYILKSDFDLPKEKKSIILNLQDFNGLDLNLRENFWQVRPGLKSLVNPNSIVRDSYYTFKKQVSYSIEIVFDQNLLVPDRGINTRIALSLFNGELTLSSYTGSLLEYTIVKEHNKFIIIIHRLIAEYHLQNLKLKRISSSGVDLKLELRQRNPLSNAVRTSFVISIAILENNHIISESKFLQVPASLVYKTRNSYFIEIGKLRLPKIYKKKGTMVKIYLSVYREFNKQTRVNGIDGIFRI